MRGPLMRLCAGTGSAAVPKVRGFPHFTRAMLVFTLGFWTVVYILFTLRSFALQQPHLEMQALLRLAMMPVGLLLCGGLFAAYVRLVGQSTWRQILSVLLFVFTAALVYSAINYVVFYALPGLWNAEHGALAKVTEYLTTGMFWLFGLWTAVFYLVKARISSESVGASGDVENERALHQRHIWVRDNDRSIRVPLSDINWVEAEKDYVRLHTSERSHLFRSTMGNLERTLDQTEFIRIHRRIIIAAKLLKSLHRRPDGRVFAELHDGIELPVGRNYLAKLKGAPSSRKMIRSRQAAGAVGEQNGIAR